MSSTLSTEPSVLAREEGVIDLWWPYAPETGRYTFKATGAETGGSLIQLIVSDARGAATPLHIHHDADETFFVLDGEVAIVVGETRLSARAGDFVLAPRGIPHAFVVVSERAEVFVTFGPAGREGESGYGFAGFAVEVADPVDGGPAPEPRLPDPEDFAQRMLEYRIELVGPPPSLD